MADNVMQIALYPNGKKQKRIPAILLKRKSVIKNPCLIKNDKEMPKLAKPKFKVLSNISVPKLSKIQLAKTDATLYRKIQPDNKGNIFLQPAFKAVSQDVSKENFASLLSNDNANDKIATNLGFTENECSFETVADEANNVYSKEYFIADVNLNMPMSEIEIETTEQEFIKNTSHSIQSTFKIDSEENFTTLLPSENEANQTVNKLRFTEIGSPFEAVENNNMSPMAYFLADKHFNIPITDIEVDTTIQDQIENTALFKQTPFKTQSKENFTEENINTSISKVEFSDQKVIGSTTFRRNNISNENLKNFNKENINNMIINKQLNTKKLIENQSVVSVIKKIPIDKFETLKNPTTPKKYTRKPKNEKTQKNDAPIPKPGPSKPKKEVKSVPTSSNGTAREPQVQKSANIEDKGKQRLRSIRISPIFPNRRSFPASGNTLPVSSSTFKVIASNLTFTNISTVFQNNLVQLQNDNKIFTMIPLECLQMPMEINGRVIQMRPPETSVQGTIVGIVSPAGQAELRNNNTSQERKRVIIRKNNTDAKKPVPTTKTKPPIIIRKRSKNNTLITKRTEQNTHVIKNEVIDDTSIFDNIPSLKSTLPNDKTYADIMNKFPLILPKEVCSNSGKQSDILEKAIASINMEEFMPDEETHKYYNNTNAQPVYTQSLNRNALSSDERAKLFYLKNDPMLPKYSSKK